MSDHIPDEVFQRLGYYVYLYVDPRTERVFYVGKGVGNRAVSHLKDRRESRKHKMIQEIRGAQRAPRIEILTHGLPDDDTAHRIEMAVIDAIGIEKLTNDVRGLDCNLWGRQTLSELNAKYCANEVEILDPVIIIRINQLYDHRISDEELYEATRGIWVLGLRRENAKYVLSTYRGVVRSVYVIEKWHRACTTKYAMRKFDRSKPINRRVEFTGRLADPEIQSKYLGKSVRKYLKQGNQSPTVYVNC